MRKKILGGLLVVAIAAVAAFNVNMNTQENELSALTLANVEAWRVKEQNLEILVIKVHIIATYQKKLQNVLNHVKKRDVVV